MISDNKLDIDKNITFEEMELVPSASFFFPNSTTPNKKKSKIIPFNSQNSLLIVLGLSLVKGFQKIFDSNCAQLLSETEYDLVSF